MLWHHDIWERRHPNVLVCKCANSAHVCRAEAARWYKVGAEIGKIGERYGDTAVQHCTFNLRRMAGIQMTEEEEAERNNPMYTTALWVCFAPSCETCSQRWTVQSIVRSVVQLWLPMLWAPGSADAMQLR